MQVALPDGRIQTVTYVADDDGFRAEVTYRNDENAIIKTKPTPKPSQYKPNFNRPFHTTPSSKLRAVQKSKAEGFQHFGFEDSTQPSFSTSAPIVVTERPRPQAQPIVITERPKPQVQIKKQTRKGTVNAAKLARQAFKRKNTPRRGSSFNSINVLFVKSSTPTSIPTSTPSLQFLQARKIASEKPFFPLVDFSPVDNHILHKKKVEHPKPKRIPAFHQREVARIPPNPFRRTKRRKNNHAPVKPKPRQINNGPPVHPLLQPNFFNRPVTPSEGLITKGLRPSLLNKKTIRPQRPKGRMGPPPQSKKEFISTTLPPPNTVNHSDKKIIQITEPIIIGNPKIIHGDFSPLHQQRLRNHLTKSARSRSRFRARTSSDTPNDISTTQSHRKNFTPVKHSSGRNKNVASLPKQWPLSQVNTFLPKQLDIAHYPHVELLKTNPQNDVRNRQSIIPFSSIPFIPVNEVVPNNPHISSAATIKSQSQVISSTEPPLIFSPVTPPAPLIPTTDSIPFVTTGNFLPTTSSPFIFEYPSRASQAPTVLFNSNKPVLIHALGQTHVIPLLLPVADSANENNRITNDEDENLLLSESELRINTPDIYPRPTRRFSTRRT